MSWEGFNELCKYQDTFKHISKGEHHISNGYYSNSFSFSKEWPFASCWGCEHENLTPASGQVKNKGRSISYYESVQDGWAPECRGWHLNQIIQGVIWWGKREGVGEEISDALLGG